MSQADIEAAVEEAVRALGDLTGPQGPVGPQGIAGGPGPEGPRGERGEVGPRGEDGPQGPVGPQGDIGPRGPEGPEGRAGDPGPAGPKGATGKTGKTGPRGPAGPQGPKGDKGDKGDTGPQGPPGQGGGGGILAYDDGEFVAATALVDFGDGLTASQVGDKVLVTGSGGPGGSALTVEDEGVELDDAVESIDFVGAGVTVTNGGHAVTVTIPGGGGVEVLEDPGEVWEAETAVEVGYRIVRGLDDEVWEVITAGTTGEEEPDWNIGDIVTDNDVEWQWVGDVGRLPNAIGPRTVATFRAGIPRWSLQAEGGSVDLYSREEDGTINARLDLGDGDLTFESYALGTGPEVAAELRVTPNIIRANLLDPTDGTLVMSLRVSSTGIEVAYDSTETYTHLLSFLNGGDLPTANPAVAGALWNDGGIVKVSAG